jgi:hypothetical protein
MAREPAALGRSIVLSPICADSIKVFVSRSPHRLYRVIRSFAATTLEDGRFLTVRKGALLALDAPLKHFGLVEAECAEQTILVFTRDIEACTECVVPTRGVAETI